MRDAYILDIVATRGAPPHPDARLQAAASALAAREKQVLGGKAELTWVGVASSDGPIARSLGLLAGFSATLCAQDMSAGSGLAALAGAARAVTSGFESVAAAVATGGPAAEPTWPAALRKRFTPVSPAQAQAWALERAGLEAHAVVESIEARRDAWMKAENIPVPLGQLGALPLAPDVPGQGVVLLAGHTEIREHNWATRARITSVVQVGLDPALGPASAAKAAEMALHRLHLRADEMDFVQVDARSAAAPAVVARGLGVSADRINPAGGALCSGGAGAASGLVDLQRLIDALEQADRRFGLVVGLEPMGGATAVVIDRQFYM